MVTEYIGRGDLSRYISTGLQELEIKQITVDLLEAMHVLHEKGFAHRDIKPEVLENLT